MEAPLQITQREIELPQAAMDRIREKAEGLEKYYPRITSCHVTVECPAKHKSKGLVHNVQIEIGVPGDKIMVKRQQGEDINAVIRDAFDAARRQLEDYARRQRGQTKTHESAP